MDRADLDQLTALTDRRAGAVDTAARELRQVGNDLVAIAAGFAGLRRAADALDTVAEIDRTLAAIYRRLGLAARRADSYTIDPPAPVATPVASGSDSDWRTWTEDDFAEQVPVHGVDDEVSGERGGTQPDDDWDETPLVADVRLGHPRSGSDQ